MLPVDPLLCILGDWLLGLEGRAEDNEEEEEEEVGAVSLLKSHITLHCILGDWLLGLEGRAKDKEPCGRPYILFTDFAPTSGTDLLDKK